MAQRRVIVLVIVGTVVSLSLAAAPAAAAAYRCGRVAVPVRHARAKVRAVHGSVSCRPARRLIAKAFTEESQRHWDGYDRTYGIYWKVRGWRCYVGLAETQTFCHRGDREVDGSLRHDDGWTF